MAARRSYDRARPTPPPGIPIDSSGGQTIDPTKNVLDLVGAAVLRIDDMAELRAQLLDEKILRMEREWIHQEKAAERERQFGKEIRGMESDRVDKIRSVDVANAAATAAQLLSAVNNLAATADRTAETLRNQVATTAAAAAANQAALINPITERVAVLEKSSYTGAGKAGVADPQLAEAILEIKRLAQARDTGTGKSEGVSLAWVVALGAIGAMGTIIASAIAVYALLKP